VARFWKYFAALGRLGGDALRIFSERGARLMAGSIAFYALLSVVPILVITLRVLGSFVDPRVVGSTVENTLTSFVGANGARTVLALVTQVQARGATPFSSALGMLALVYGSTRLFSQLTTALDLLWNTPPPPRPKGFAERALRQLERRGAAFGMVVIVGIVLLALVLLHTGLAATRNALGIEAVPSHAVEALGSFLLSALLFSLTFRLLPRARVALRDALVGGVVTALLFTLGSLAVTAYVTRRDMSVYGAASSIVMLMLWVNYNAQAFFLGAAFTRAHGQSREVTARAGA
jgi:membrane protein